MKIQSRLKGAAAPIALCVMLSAQPVLAQSNQAQPEDAANAAAAAEAAEAAAETEATTDEEEGAIFVTGSRIRQDEFSSPAPITVVDPEIAVRQGLMDTSEMIQGSPIASGSSQITAALSSQFLTNGGQGAQTISLRGLGAERTLVMLNSRRAGPAGTRGAVSSFDLNVLPQAVVQRVDILKDGASSIYGSDAVAGVVNMLTKTDTDGFEFDVFGSLPYNSGGEVFSATAMWGTTFDGGHVLASGTYYKQNELARGDRSYLQCEETYVFTDLEFDTRADNIDPRTGRYHCGGGESNITWGHIWTYDYSYYYGGGSNIPTGENPLTFGPGQAEVSLLQYSYPGDNLGAYIPGVGPGPIGIPAGWFPVGYGPASESVQNNYHPNMNTDSVIPETERFTIYLDGALELFSGVEAYTELLYNKRKTYYEASFQVWQFGLGEDTFGTLAPPGVGDQFAVGFNGPATFSPTAYNDWWDSWQEVDYYRGVLGFRGDISSDWSWDLYGQYSLSDGDYGNQRVLNDSIRTQDGRTNLNAPNGFRTARCPGGVTPIGGKTCVMVDWYTPRVMYGDFTQQEAEFLFDSEVGNTEYTQWYIEGVVTGDTAQWFELPGGPVGVALGATYRNDEIEDVPGAITLAGNAWQSSRSGITAGTTDTMEAFGELRLPVLADVPLVRSLTFMAAGRVTNVKATRSDGVTDETNGNFTYKLAGDWEVTDWLRFRSTYGTSFRAPALFEQFLADETGGFSQRDVDPCIQWGIALAQGAISQRFADNCAADGVAPNHTGSGISVTTYTGGGFGLLEPETSKALTASMILTPQFEFTPNTDFSLAFDYFNIEVNDEIAQLGAANIVFQCYNSDFFPTDPLCDLFARVDDLDPSDIDWNAGDPTNIARVRDSFLNVASQKSEGLDVTARIQHDFGGDTTLTFQAQMTWQFEDVTALFADTPESSNGEAGDPEWVGDFRVILDHGPWSFFYGLDAIGATSDEQDWIDAAESDPALRSRDDLCQAYVTLGTVCMDLTLPATFYHNISMTREIGEQFELTVGVANLFGQKPPRASSVGANGIQNYGRGVLYSQYDLIGTRFFANINARF